MQVTIQTKVDPSAKKFLEDTAKYIGKLRGKLGMHTAALCAALGGRGAPKTAFPRRA